MKNIILSILVFFTLFGCSNFESEEYIKEENKAINKLIPKLFSIKNYEIDNIENVEIFVITSLTNEIEIISDDEQKIILFEPFLAKSINNRILNFEFNYKNLNITQISKQQFEKKYPIDNKGSNEIYLLISRISFNQTFDLGYMNYQIYCGEGCFWSNNIEIKRIKGQWVISRLLSGNIA